MTIGNLKFGGVKDIYEQMTDIQKEINALDFQKKELADKLGALKEQAMTEMRVKGEKTHYTSTAIFTIKDSYVRHDFDKERFKAENGELYNKYLKDTEINGSMLIKIKG